jgi:hypothetical protein
MPWPVLSPFRMRPGLQRLANDLPSPEGGPPLPDALAPAYATARRARLPQAWVGEPDPRVLQRLAQALQAQGVEVAPAGGQVDALAVSAALQDDYVILHDEPERGGSSRFRLRFLSVAFPSNWDPAEKLGLDFAAIHAPVADNALIQQGAEGIMDLAFRRQPMQRHVWLLSPDGELPQHPRERQRRWEDALARAGDGRLLDAAFFRVERQTTWPMPDLGRGVFFIRVMVCPLVAVLSVAPGRAAALRDALVSMSAAVVAYRGMGLVRDRLVDELQALAAHNGATDTRP